jgi:hypothetical protein
VGGAVVEETPVPVGAVVEGEDVVGCVVEGAGPVVVVPGVDVTDLGMVVEVTCGTVGQAPNVSCSWPACVVPFSLKWPPLP